MLVSRFEFCPASFHSVSVCRGGVMVATSSLSLDAVRREGSSPSLGTTTKYPSGDEIGRHVR